MRAITDEEFAIYRQTMHQRDAEHRAKLNQRFVSANRVAKLASNLLRQDFQAKQVILFGSLVSQNLFHVTSDIDLAVSGLTPLDYFSAVARLQDLSTFKIDLVRIESCKPSLKAVIQGEGQEI